MKRLLVISFWIVSILLLAFVLVSLGYRFMESILIASLFLPGALAVKYLFPKVSFADKKKGIVNISFITAGVVVAEILMIFMTHFYIVRVRMGNYVLWDEWPEPPQVIVNPVFIAIMIAVLSIANFYFEKWIDVKFPSEEKPVSFISDRKQVSLMRAEILYIESNDSETMVYATLDRSFRNKTLISQWENYLGEGFLRIHRSYLVNVVHVTAHDADTVKVGDIELPVSRKYKGVVSTLP